MFIFIHALFLLFVAHVLSDYLFTSNFGSSLADAYKMNLRIYNRDKERDKE